MIIKPPNKEFNSRVISVFLAGTIDNGQSEDWQSVVSTQLELDYPHRLNIYNPRREVWNANADTVEQSEQIWWELDYLNAVDIVFFNFLPDSKSPVTLLELGLVLARNANCVVVCPIEFYRYLNVKLACTAHGRLSNTKLDVGYRKLKDKIDHLLN